MNKEYYQFMQRLMVSQLLAWATAIVIVLKAGYAIATSDGIFKKFNEGSALDVIINGCRYELIPEVSVEDHVDTDDITKLVNDVMDNAKPADVKPPLVGKAFAQN